MNPKKILVPVALDDVSRSAFRVAVKLAKSCDAAIALLHAVNLAIVGENRGIARTRLIEELRLQAGEQLRFLAARESSGVPVEVVIREGVPSQAIVDEAVRLKSDSIVMAAHSHHPWFKWLHRNTARAVLKKATCPVWLLSPADKGGTATLVVVAPDSQPLPFGNILCHNN
jgi:universal stress protein A